MAHGSAAAGAPRTRRLALVSPGFPLSPGFPPALLLASASPARARLLRDAGFDPHLLVSGVDEDAVEAELGPVTPAELAGALASAKARAVAARLRHDPDAWAAAGLVQPGANERSVLVLGCDSVLEFDGRPYGRPATVDAARQRWRAMRGRSGTLHSGHHVVLLRPDSGPPAADGRPAAGPTPQAQTRWVAAVASTVVHFAAISDAELEAYLARPEPLEVAGAFTLDGFGAVFVDRIVGDPSCVLGLSLPLLRAMLSELGISITALWRV